jgi:predicted dehydrogenase
MNLKQFQTHALGQDANSTAAGESGSLICYRPGLGPEVLVQQETDVLHAVFRREISYFIDCITGRTTNRLAPVADAVTALGMALACVQSAETGQVVAIRR